MIKVGSVWPVFNCTSLFLALGAVGTLQQGVKRRSEAYKRNKGTHFVKCSDIALQR